MGEVVEALELLVLLALALLLISITVGYVLWIRPIEAGLDMRSRGVLFFILLTLFGAFWGSLPWWFDEDASFAWNLPPLASRMLGAAGFTFVVACLFTLIKPSYDKLRLMLVIIGVYMLPLAVAIMVFHLGRFDFSEPVVWGFFPLVFLMCGATVYFLVNTPVIGHPGDPGAGEPLAILRVWLLVVGVVTLAWGLALFVTDSGFSKEIWAWPGDLLSSRLIAVMLLTVAATSIWAVIYPSTTTMTLSVTSAYGLAGAIANIWQDFLGKPVKYDYVIVLGVIGVVSSALLLWRVTGRRVTHAGEEPRSGLRTL